MLHTITSEQGIQITLCNFGARVHAILCADSKGKFDDIILGCEFPKDYSQKDFQYFGATVGRYANRIANASFKIDGELFQLDQNDNSNCLHGGNYAFNSKFWQIEYSDQSSIQYSLLSYDGDNGFPGTLKLMVTYTLNRNRLHINYTCASDRTTHLNLTHHSYFNLSGNHKKSILDHLLYINSNKYLSINDQGIPISAIHLDDDPVFDFRELKPISDHINTDHPQLKLVGGYDHNYIIKDQEEIIATLIDPDSGRQLNVYSSEPGLQFFSGNIQKTSAKGKNQISYDRHAGLCLEPQHFPDSPNRSDFPTTLLHANDVYRSETIFEFKTTT